MKWLIPLIFLAGCEEQPLKNAFVEPEVAIVQEALRAAKAGDSAAWAKVAGSAEFIGDPEPRLAKLSDLQSRCTLDRFEVKGFEVIANGGCAHSENPDFGWPYQVKFQLEGNRIAAIEPHVSEM